MSYFVKSGLTLISIHVERNCHMTRYLISPINRLIFYTAEVQSVVEEIWGRKPVEMVNRGNIELHFRARRGNTVRACRAICITLLDDVFITEKQ